MDLFFCEKDIHFLSIRMPLSMIENLEDAIFDTTRSPLGRGMFSSFVENFFVKHSNQDGDYMIYNPSPKDG